MIYEMDKTKPTTYKNIPVKILSDVNDVISSLLSDIFNKSVLKGNFLIHLNWLTFHQPIKRMNAPSKITIDQYVYYPLSLSYLKKSCTIKYTLELINFFPHTYAALEKAIVLSIA